MAMPLPPSPHPTLRSWWPQGIVAAFILFIAGTLVLVVLSTRQRDELVMTDYYDQELRYQQQLDRLQRTESVRHQVRVAYEAAARQIRISLPPQHASTRPSGRIQLYRPADARHDREFDLDLDLTGHQLLDARDLPDGLWRVKIRWSVEREEFSLDERLVIKTIATAAASFQPPATRP
jgi:hypothetical protein